MASQTVIVGGYKIWKQGFLLKTPSRGTMRRRLERYWFVLFEEKDMMAFLYFQDEDHFLERKKNKGFFRFDDATSVDVVKEYMGKKNAFCIATPRTKYYIVSESRYELHQWVYIIQHALEDFRKRHSQAAHKAPSKPRPVSSGGTPTHKTSPRVKPSRPAPPAPKMRKSLSQVDEPSIEHLGAFAAEEPPTFDDPTLPPTTPLDNIVAGLLADANHMQDVEYEMTEDEPHHYHDVSPPEPEAQVADEGPAPVNGVDEARSDRETSEERDKYSLDQLTDSLDNITERSTLPMDRASNKKRNRKQGGSLKAHRSVSPPNLPPPPPPLVEDSPEKHASLKSPLKMTELQNFESELDQISRELIQKPKVSRPPIPARTTSLPPDQVGEGVSEYMDEAFHQEDLGNISPEPPEEHKVWREPPKVPSEASAANLTAADGGQDVAQKEDTPTGHRRQVAFEGSATKRPDPSYEPRIDKESLPSSVAEAKKQLFGNQETETARYRKLNTNNNNDSGGSASPGTPKRGTSVSDELFQSIESALQNTDYMEKQSMDSKGQGLWPAMLAGSHGASLEEAYATKSSPQQPLSKERRPMGLSRSSERLHKVDPQTTSPTHYSPGLLLKRNESQPRSGGAGRRSAKGKRGQPDYSTLPTWSQMKASGMQVSVESNSQTQKTVYRSLV